MRWLLIVALAASACTGGTESKAGSPVVVVGDGVVENGRFERRVFLTGELDTIKSVDIVVPQTDTWQLTISWMIEDGTAVKKGDRVVEFDNSAFTAQLESQRVLVKQAERDFATQRHLRSMTVADKENAAAVARLERDKAAIYAAVERDLVSERTYQERQLALERAEAGLATALADLASASRAADLDLKLKRVAADKAKRALANAEASIAAQTVAAPEDGIAMVSSHPWMGTKIVAGDTVQPGWTVVELPYLSALVIRARLSDVDDGRIAVGMDAEVVFDAEPTASRPGKVSAISAVAREQSRESLMRAFDVDVTLGDNDGELTRPGMSARVEVVSRVIEDATLVPRAALRWRDGEAVARLKGGGEATLEIIECDALRCAVASGIAPGAAVELEGAR